MPSTENLDNKKYSKPPNKTYDANETKILANNGSESLDFSKLKMIQGQISMEVPYKFLVVFDNFIQFV